MKSFQLLVTVCLFATSCLFGQVFTTGDTTPVITNTSSYIYESGTVLGDKIIIGNTGIGTLNVNAGGTMYLPPWSSYLSVGEMAGSYGTITVAGGTLTADDLEVGKGGSGVLFIGVSGTLNVRYFGTGNNGGTAVLTVSGGAINGTGTLRLGDDHNSSASFTVTNGGSVSVMNLYVGEGTGRAVLTVSNPSSVTVGMNLEVGSSGTLAFALSGTFTSSPVISVGSTVQVSSGNTYVIDLENYAATSDMTIVLMTYATLSGDSNNVHWEFKNYEDTRYSIENPIWGANELTVKINSIPESSASAAILGALALIFTARRKGK